MHYIKYLLLAFFSIYLLLFGCTSSTKSNSNQKSENSTANVEDATFQVTDDRGYIVKVGDIAPDFEMSFPDGKSVILSSLRGKVVMLQFTASWCGVCRKEMPHIEKDIWEKHRNNPNFVLYGIDREEPVEKIEELINKTGVTYPIGLDPEAEIFTLYAKKEAGITRNVIIGKDGRIVMLTRLYDEEEFKEMVELIDKLLE
jgi:peroxiredoxin